MPFFPPDNPALRHKQLKVPGKNDSLARSGEGYGDGMQQRGGTPMTAEQQAAAQKIYDDYYSQTSALRQQLTSKRYEYNALLTASSPDTAKINAVAKEMEALNQSLDEQRVKRDVAMAQAGVPRGAGMGYGGCGGGGNHRGGGHMGMGHW